MLGVTADTLRNWDAKGSFTPDHKTESGHRLYSKQQLERYLGIGGSKARKNVGYARVSSATQKNDLERQVELLEVYLSTKGVPFEIITDIGSGINYKKKGLNDLIDRVLRKEIGVIAITYEDRLLRFGSEMLERIFEQFGTSVEVILQKKDKTLEEELVEDLIQIITVFSGRLHGHRKGKADRAKRELSEEGTLS